MATMGGQTLSKDPGLTGERCFMHCVAGLAWRSVLLGRSSKMD